MMNFDNKINNVIENLRESPVDIEFRTTTDIAKKLLVNNQSVIAGGNIFYFGLRNLGLGVWAAWKRDLKFKQTLIASH
jgi:hypothetical protein